MSGNFDTPRVRLRLSVDADADGDELPFVLGIIGDFSGAGSRHADPPSSPRFQSTRPPVSHGWGGETVGISDLLRLLRPCIRLDGLPFARGVIDWRPIHGLPVEPRPPAWQAEGAADALSAFGPAAIALSPAAPVLRATTALLHGLLRWRAGGAATPTTREVDVAALAALCRAAGRVLSDPVADALLAALPDPADSLAPIPRLLALGGWIEVALAQQAALQALPSDRLADRFLAPLARFDLDGALRDGFVPAFWRVLEHEGGRRELPWAEDAAPLPIRLLLASSPPDLVAVLRGLAAPEAAHAGWLAAGLEAAAASMVTAVLHHPEFQAVEANWRALGHLLDIATGPGCELRVLDMTQDAVRADLDAVASPDLSSLHHLLHGEGLGALGAAPQTLLLCLFELGPDPRDARLAQQLAQLGRAAICPVLCSASPALLDQALREDWDGPAPAWQDARQDKAASFLGLCAPRLLARARHRTPPGQAAPLRYQEPASADPAALPWVGGAVGLAQRALVAFQRFNWHVAIAGTADDQGVVWPLALEPIGTAGANRPPVAVALTERDQEAARRAGIAVMVHLPGRDAVAFLDAPSMMEPPPLREGIGDADPTVRRLASRLPYTFAGTRVGHHLLVTLRQELGRAPMTDTDVESLARRWLAQYVTWQPDAAAATRAEKPLRRAEVKASVDRARPGIVGLEVALRPHFQVDGLGVDFTLSDTIALPTQARDAVPESANGP